MRKLLFYTYFTVLVLDYEIEKMLSKAFNILYYLQHFRGDVKNVVDLDGRDHVREGEGVLSMPLYKLFTLSGDSRQEKKTCLED